MNLFTKLIYKTYLQNGKRLRDFENKPMVTKEEMSGEGYWGKG